MSTPEWIYHNAKKLPFVRKVEGMLRFSSQRIAALYRVAEIHRNLGVDYVCQYEYIPAILFSEGRGNGTKNAKERTLIYLDPEMHDTVSANGAGREGIDGRTDTAGGQRISEAAPEKGGAAMRGDGSIFQRGRIWWIAYSLRGHLYQESSKSDDKRDCQKLLRKRLRKSRSRISSIRQENSAGRLRT